VWDAPAILDYLRAYDSVSEARASISRYLAFYNEGRPHSSLDERTPDEAYFGSNRHEAPTSPSRGSPAIQPGMS